MQVTSTKLKNKKRRKDEQHIFNINSKIWTLARWLFSELGKAKLIHIPLEIVFTGLFFHKFINELHFTNIAKRSETSLLGSIGIGHKECAGTERGINI